jgi:hypothetical protein
MNCIDCNTDLSNGYQAASNLNLCNACADYRAQGEDACIGCGSNEGWAAPSSIRYNVGEQ